MLVESLYSKARQAYLDAKQLGLSPRPTTRIIRNLWGVTLTLGMAVATGAAPYYVAPHNFDSTYRVVDITSLDRSFYRDTGSPVERIKPWQFGPGWRTIIDNGVAVRFYDRSNYFYAHQISASTTLLPPPLPNNNEFQPTLRVGRRDLASAQLINHLKRADSHFTKSTASALSEIFSAFNEHHQTLSRGRALRLYFKYLVAAKSIASEDKRIEALYLTFLNAKI